ncbi:hypothetical protein, partial [Hungatella hathewayi]|uniref:hypothetical protein n=1 Tax=Hungatella hathewayi TaxID=154046 RepID=UPI003563AE9D
LLFKKECGFVSVLQKTKAQKLHVVVLRAADVLQKSPKPGTVLRPRLPGGTKTPKSQLKLMTKAAFHNSVSLQVYPDIYPFFL